MSARLARVHDHRTRACTFRRGQCLKRTEPPIPTLLNLAITKAELAYGPAFVSDPNNAIDHLRDNPNRLDDCMRELQLCGTPKAVLWDRINA